MGRTLGCGRRRERLARHSARLEARREVAEGRGVIGVVQALARSHGLRGLAERAETGRERGELGGREATLDAARRQHRLHLTQLFQQRRELGEHRGVLDRQRAK